MNGGFLGQKLKNMGVVKKRPQKRISVNNVQTPSNERDKMKTMMNDLKSAVVNDSNLYDIKRMLTETMKHRERLMQNKQIDAKETFSFFYARPELVNIDYIIFFLIDHRLIHRIASNSSHSISLNGLIRQMQMLLSKNGNPLGPYFRKFSAIITKSTFTHHGLKILIKFCCCYDYFLSKTRAETLERLSLSIELSKNCFCSEKYVFVRIRV